MASAKWNLSRRLLRLFSVGVFIASPAWMAAQDADALKRYIDALKRYIKEASPVLVLAHPSDRWHGRSPQEDLCVVIESGRTTRVEDASVKHAHPSNAKILDLSGKTVILGLVGMHEHLY
jgi:imidazolonepropionase-like amidohydrolase